MKRLALWLIDRAGPAEARQARREAAVAARVRVVQGVRRLSPRHRRMRAERLAIIGQIEALAADPRQAPVRAAARRRQTIAEARIAILIPGFLSGFGGAEKVAGQVAGLLVEAGAEVDLVCIAPDGPAAEHPYALDPSVTLQVLDRYGEEGRLKPRRYDLAIAFGMPGFYRRIPSIAEVLDTPFVIQECTNPRAMQQALKSSLSLESDIEAHWLRQAVLAQAVGARFTTPAYASTVHPDIAPFAYGFYNAFAPASQASPEPLPPKRKLIVVGGLKNKNKNGLAAAEAFLAFAGRRAGWTLHFYGENNFGEALRRLQCQAGPGIIQDEGTVRDIGLIYKDAYGLIIPSFEEGLPNVVVEAFSYGVPCIGFDDCEGVRHLIADQETGLLVDRRVPQGLEHAIEKLADPACRAALSANAAAFARAELGLEVWRQRWLRLVANALAGQAATGAPADPAANRAQAGDRARLWRRLLACYSLTG